MMIQTPSTIYKSDFRTWTANTNVQHADILSIYKHVENRSFGNLKKATEEVFSAQSSAQFSLEKDEFAIVLPVYGDFELRFGGNHFIAEIEQIIVISGLEHQFFSVTNQQSEESINFLLFYFDNLHQIKSTKKDFSLATQNKWIPLCETLPFPAYIAVFGNRKEIDYQLSNPKNGIFTFVIQGVFEFQNRLLDARDALTLWDIDQIEIESLGENSLVLIFEVENI